MNHIALARRNAGTGWVLMATDGSPWRVETVAAEAPLARTMDEALALVGRHPEADFTFITRLAHEVWAAPFDRQSDLAGLDRGLGQASVTIMVPIGLGRWRMLHRAPGQWFEQADTCEAADVRSFLCDTPQDAETIDLGLGGPIEVWLRRRWNADAILQPRVMAAAGNVTPFIRKPSAMQLNAGNRR